MAAHQPPPDVVAAIEKMAMFKVKNGDQFETLIKEKQRDNPKFSFLFEESTQAHQFYKMRVIQLQMANPSITATAAPAPSPATNFIGPASGPTVSPSAATAAPPALYALQQQQQALQAQVQQYQQQQYVPHPQQQYPPQQPAPQQPVPQQAYPQYAPQPQDAQLQPYAYQQQWPAQPQPQWTEQQQQWPQQPQWSDAQQQWLPAQQPQQWGQPQPSQPQWGEHGGWEAAQWQAHAGMQHPSLTALPDSAHPHAQYDFSCNGGQAHPHLSSGAYPSYAAMETEPIANAFSAYNIPVGLLATVLRRRCRRDPRTVVPFRPLEPDELPTELPARDSQPPGVAEAVDLFYSGGRPLTVKEKRERERERGRRERRERRERRSRRERERDEDRGRSPEGGREASGDHSHSDDRRARSDEPRTRSEQQPAQSDDQAAHSDEQRADSDNQCSQNDESDNQRAPSHAAGGVERGGSARDAPEEAGEASSPTTGEQGPPSEPVAEGAASSAAEASG